jgi:hypothetical protein
MTTPEAPSQSAIAYIRSTLAGYGLGDLGDWAYQKLIGGDSIEQIFLDMRDTDTYKRRFPAMAELSKRGEALSEAEYISTEKAYKQVMSAYGLPKGFYDTPDDFTRFMVGSVAPAELNDRVREYNTAVMGDTETLNQLRDLYGTVGSSRNAAADLLAVYLDPERAAPILTEQLQAAQFSAAGVRSGFGGLSRAEAEQFGARQDITAQQAEQGFGALYAGRELGQRLPGEAEAGLDRNVLLGAAFGGDALAKEKVEKRARLRVQEGSGGGSYAADRTGLSGLGSSQT